MSTKYYSHTRTEIMDFLPTECATVLDVGCAGGAFGRALKEQRQVEVWGG